MSYIPPLPNRALTPSGKCHYGESWARTFGAQVRVKNKIARTKDNFVAMKILLLIIKRL